MCRVDTNLLRQVGREFSCFSWNENKNFKRNLIREFCLMD